MDFQANKTSNTWQGVAIVPIAYLPQNVTKMNAYAIHGTDGVNRTYESLYPRATGSATDPDLYFFIFFTI